MGGIPFLTLLSKALAIPGEHTVDAEVCIYGTHFLLSSALPKCSVILPWPHPL